MDQQQKVSIVLAGENRLSKPINEAVKSVGDLTKSADSAEKTMQQLGQKSQLINRFKSVSAQLDDTKSKMAGARAELKRLEAGGVAAGQSASQHAAAVRKAKRDVDRLTNTLGRQSREVHGLRADLASAGLKVNALGAEELRLAKQTKAANVALEQQAAKLQRIQSIQGRMDNRKAQMGELAGDAVGVAAAAIPFVAAGKRAVEYEGTFADVKKVVNFKDEAEEAKYRTEMMKLAGKLGMNQDGIAQIVTAAGQSGIEKDQLLQFAESATKMSVAWDVSAEQAGSTLATWRAAMGLSQKQALDLADATNYLSNNMNAKAKDIAAVMVREGSTAMQSGLNYNQTAALAASLIAGGATEETGATALKNITGRLTMGYAASGSQKEALDRIGFDPEELASMMQDDAQGTLIEVFRALQEQEADERGAIISQLFGEEAKGAVSKLVTTLDNKENGLIAAFGRVAEEADRASSVQTEYANRASTRGHQLAKLNSTFDHMMITLGDRMLPVIDLLVPPLITVVDGIATFAETSPNITTGLLLLAGGAVAFKAGAIAFNMLRLAMGNGMDKLRLGRESLAGTTDKTAKSATRATGALAKLNAQLAGMGGGSGRSRRGRKSRRGFGGSSAGAGLAASVSLAGDTAPTRRGKAGRLAALLGGGTALSLLSANANAGELAMAGATVAGTAGDLVGSIPGGMEMLKGAGKLFRPADIALSGAALTAAISNGDNKAIGGTAGDMIGGLGGAAAGAMAGAAMGSVVPVIGTAIGGVLGSVVGGFGGGELGGWIGEHIAGWFSTDKTDDPAPTAVASNTKQLQQSNKSIHFAPVLQITPSGDPAYDDRVANDIMARLHNELAPVLLGQVDTTADTGLHDRRDT